MLIIVDFLFLNVYLVRPLSGTIRASIYSVHFTGPQGFSGVREQMLQKYLQQWI